MRPIKYCIFSLHTQATRRLASAPLHACAHNPCPVGVREFRSTGRTNLRSKHCKVWQCTQLAAFTPLLQLSSFLQVAQSGCLSRSAAADSALHTISMAAVATRALSAASRRAATARYFSEQAVNTELRLNVAVPHTTLVADAEVKLVTMPARDGVMGIEKNSPPIIAELKPGMLRVDYLDGKVEEFFVPGGVAFNHDNNKCDISVPEGVSVEDIDGDRLREDAAAWNAKKASAAAGSKEAVEAEAALEVLSAAGKAIGVTI